MSKKDFDKYYAEVKGQYLEMLNELEDLSIVSNEAMVSPETIDNLKKFIEPLKQNYLTLSYVAFLLDQPRRTHKIEGYKKRNKKQLILSQNHTKDAIIGENNAILKELPELKEDGRLFERAWNK